MELAKLDFQQLRVKHIFFKTKIRALLYGGSYDEVHFSPKGLVNVWFDSVGLVRYGSEPEIQELANIHQRLNFSALTLLRQYKNGMIDQAHDGLKGIDLLSDQFLAILSKAEQRLSATSR
ncbi:histidine kinase [Pontibacter qinzhouensis]|uniref:Histidine kinase n=1 Tax=Pontibacter qinzhouensis TaxID=2603253 RepID=A0A5C8JEY7_9BACT|nr:histidine kinase [Pontibacter qinzhouensis]TXK36860.1 histidine kinase [Pontibacter qinzhouensis]